MILITRVQNMVCLFVFNKASHVSYHFRWTPFVFISIDIVLNYLFIMILFMNKPFKLTSTSSQSVYAFPLIHTLEYEYRCFSANECEKWLISEWNFNLQISTEISWNDDIWTICCKWNTTIIWIGNVHFHRKIQLISESIFLFKEFVTN